MTDNELFNAISGIDPKYIDEAAFEIHGIPEYKKGSKVVSFNKGLKAVFPVIIAAAILLAVTIALPALWKNTASMSESTAPSEAASYSDTDMASDSAMYEAEEAMTGGTTDSAKSEDEDVTKPKRYHLYSPSYEDGILTISIFGELPDDFDDTDYKITSTKADGSYSLYDEGTMGEIIKEKDPLTLDLTDLYLPKGTYEISIADDIIEFVIP